MTYQYSYPEVGSVVVILFMILAMGVIVFLSRRR